MTWQEVKETAMRPERVERVKQASGERLGQQPQEPNMRSPLVTTLVFTLKERRGCWRINTKERLQSEETSLTAVLTMINQVQVYRGREIASSGDVHSEGRVMGFVYGLNVEYEKCKRSRMISHLA